MGIWAYELQRVFFFFFCLNPLFVGDFGVFDVCKTLAPASLLRL